MWNDPLAVFIDKAILVTVIPTLVLQRVHPRCKTSTMINV